MSTPPALLLLFALLEVTLASVSAVSASSENLDHGLMKKVELFEGVTVGLPGRNDTQTLFSLQVDTGSGKAVSEGRGKQKKLLQRILPMFIMPFLIQSAIVPMFLSMLKFMLFKAMMIGKLALGFVILNAFRNHNIVKGRDSEMAQVHYGYQGNDMYEYGAYIPH